MPPVVKERGNDVANDGTPKEREAFPEMEERGFLKPAIPRVTRKNDDPYLNGIDDHNAKPPGF